VKKSGISVEENKETIKIYDEKNKKLSHIKRTLRKYQTIKTLLIFLCILLVFIGLIGGYLGFIKKIPVFASVLIIGIIICICIGLIIIIKKKINVVCKNTNEIKTALETEIQKLLNEAWEQMAPLNALFDWNMPAEIITRTTPLIQMDKYFDAKKLQYLKEKYHLLENDKENVSTVFVQSGSILGNPFLLCRNYRQLWINKTYTGTLTIHWTELVRGSNGKMQTVHRTDILHASVTKPAPNYDFETYLIYGNDAAPNLSFYRYPSNVNGKSEKEISKMVSAGAKNLDKLAREAVQKNKNYTRLNNDEFEVLFGGENRDNEVEFRLLFTPLAQKNEIRLIKSQIPYGDDFYFEKAKELNYIKSNHSQSQDYYADPNQFAGFSIDRMKENFVKFNDTYFQSLFFDFIPLISIPLYQQHKPKEYIYQEEYRSNITSFEHEALANSFDVDLLKNPETSTDVILKATFEKKNKTVDLVKIRANSFKSIERVELIPVFGKDGHMHSVPVPWIEYEPVYQETMMEVFAKDSSRTHFNSVSESQAFQMLVENKVLKNAFIYERGLMAALLKDRITDTDIEEMDTLFKTKK
ncbi:MAG: hypothetical protein K2I42_00505, partial [Anaeroplasmataceae bacterium]|nr:hypothetical protein [Anaeroplasmataceae bacterium]